MNPLGPDVTDNALADQYARRFAVLLHNRNWERARELVDSYRLESARAVSSERSDWRLEAMANVPGIPQRLANDIEKHFQILWVGDFLRLVPDAATLLQARNVGEEAVRTITSAFRAIGIGWPLAQVPDEAADLYSPGTINRIGQVDRRRTRVRDEKGLFVAHLAGSKRKPKARCQACGRYTLDPRALIQARFECECGFSDWLTDFDPPGPDAIMSVTRRHHRPP